MTNKKVKKVSKKVTPVKVIIPKIYTAGVAEMSKYGWLTIAKTLARLLLTTTISWLIANFSSLDFGTLTWLSPIVYLAIKTLEQYLLPQTYVK